MARSLPGEGDPGSEKPRRGAQSAGRPKRREPEAGRSTRRRESSGEARPAPRAGERDPERRPAGPCAPSAPPGANGSPLLTHVATLQARAVPGPELRLDHLWGVPGQTGDRRWAGCAPAARPEQPCSLPSAPGNRWAPPGPPTTRAPPSPSLQPQVRAKRPGCPLRPRPLQAPGSCPARRGAWNPGLGGPRLLHQAWPGRHREGPG